MKKVLKNAAITLSIVATLAVAVLFADNVMNTMDSVVAMSENISSSEIM